MPSLKRKISTLFHNLSFMSRYDVRPLLREDLKRICFQSPFSDMILYSQNIEDDEGKKKAIEYTKETGCFEMIPYHRTRPSQPIKSGINRTLMLPYIVHNGANLYFPSDWNLHQAESTYRHFIEDEQLTGERFREYAPHCYVSQTFTIEKDDVLIDAGCAEGLLSLSFIDNASRIYLIENDPIWFKPIEATFKEYLDNKVFLIKKTINNYNSGDTITLQNIIENDPHDSFFIKMDIEGAEIDVLKASLDFLCNTGKKIKLAICCYHRRNDAQEIEKLIEKIGYSYSYSDGYILASFFDPSEIPSLRRGVIRAFNRM